VQQEIPRRLARRLLGQQSDDSGAIATTPIKRSDNGCRALASQRVYLTKKHKPWEHGQQMGKFRFACEPPKPWTSAYRRKAYRGATPRW